MNRIESPTRHTVRKSKQSGMTLVELMFALAILGVGLLALNAAFVLGMSTNNKNSKDTTSTLIAQSFLEQIAAEPASSTAAFTISDCTGNGFNVNPSDGSAPGATLDASGNIDWTAAGVNNWIITNFKDCTAGGSVVAYEIRWNITPLAGGYTRRITVGARQAAGTKLGGLKYAVPVSLTTIGGN